MVFWWATAFAIFPAGKVYGNIGQIILIEISLESHWTLSNNILKWTQLNSNRFLWPSKSYSRAKDKFTICSRLSDSLLAIWKTILKLEEKTNRNQEFGQQTNRKQGGPPRNLVVISLVNIIFSICFHLHWVGNGNDNISSELTWACFSSSHSRP